MDDDDAAGRPEGRPRRDAERRPGRRAAGREEVAEQARVSGRPVRRPGPGRQSVPKPRLPEERPRLPRDAYRDLRGSVPAPRLDDVMRAVGAAVEALDEGDPDRALPYLEWAKAVAPRSSVIREALGIAQYQRGAFAAANAELTAYRRLSGREDQNHLLADCARAAGRHDRVREYVEAMTRAPGVGRDRVVEGLLVLAGDLADRGAPEDGLAVLERAGLRPERLEPWQPRVWYAAAELAERLGDLDQARDYLEAIVAVDPDFLDAAERLEGGFPSAH